MGVLFPKKGLFRLENKKGLPSQIIQLEPSSLVLTSVFSFLQCINKENNYLREVYLSCGVSINSLFSFENKIIKHNCLFWPYSG